MWHSRNIQGIGWVILTGLLIITINTIARILIQDYGYHFWQILFFYCALGCVVYLPLVLKSHTSFHTMRIRLHFLRACLEFCGFSLVFLALTKLPLPVHTALSFTSPLFGAIAAVVFLKEKSSRHRWLALGMGFVGVLIVTRPWATSFGSSALIMVLAAVCFSICMICIKKLTYTEPSSRIAFYMLFLTAMIALPFAAAHWQMPQSAHLPYILFMGVLVALVQFSVTQAFSKADVTLISPFFFVNLLWSALYGWMVFGEIVSLWTVAGGAVILLGAFYAAHHARRSESKNVVTGVCIGGEGGVVQIGEELATASSTVHPN